MQIVDVSELVPSDYPPAIRLGQQTDISTSLQVPSVTSEIRCVSQCTEQSMHTANIIQQIKAVIPLNTCVRSVCIPVQ